MMTFADFEANYTGKRYEYVNGAVMPMGPEFINPDGEAVVYFTAGEGMILAKIAALIGGFVDAHQLGVCLMDAGYMLSHNPPELRGADIGFVANSRKHLIPRMDSWLQIAPDLVVRIAQSGVDAASRIPVSQEGTQLLLVVYSDSRVIDVYRPNQPIITLRPGDVLDCSDVMPGFSVPVADIFTVLD